MRYRVIDNCLRDKDQSWNWKALADKCSEELALQTGQYISLSERTIKGDIAQMRNNALLGYYAPIEYNRLTKSYEYAQNDYRLEQAKINSKDRSELQKALLMLNQFGALNNLQGIQSALAKIQQSLDQENNETFRQVLFFDRPSETAGQQWLQELYNHINNQQCINVLYRPFGKAVSSYRISPYLLKEYKYRWYLIGYSHKDDELRVYGLDRIEGINNSLSSYRPNVEVDLAKFFDPVIGVTLLKDREVQQVIFAVNKEAVNYISTSPLHPSQRKVRVDGDLTLFSINVIPNYELTRELLSYGAQLTVLSPESVVNAVKEHMAALKDRYL